MPETRIIGDGIVITELDASLDETVRLCCHRDPLTCTCPPAQRDQKALALEALSVAQVSNLCECMRLLVRAHRQRHVGPINEAVLSAILRAKGWAVED